MRSSCFQIIANFSADTELKVSDFSCWHYESKAVIAVFSFWQLNHDLRESKINTAYCPFV